MDEGVRLQAFIFNWPGKKQHAAQLEQMLRQHCEVFVINSDDSLRNKHPHWHHIGNNAYFTEQWNEALKRFDGDVFLHIQADVWPQNVGKMIAECLRCMREHNVGVYAPDLDFQPQAFSPRSLVPVEKGIYEVPLNDNSIWAIKAAVLQNTPAIDPKDGVPVLWLRPWPNEWGFEWSATIDSGRATYDRGAITPRKRPRNGWRGWQIWIRPCARRLRNSPVSVTGWS